MLAAMSSSKSITVSIVSHGQQKLIAPLLEQLEMYCAHVIAKIVLTVNIPEPDALTSSTWHLPVERIHNLQPHGFGTNHNAAFARCTSPWFLVLNPDIRLDADTLGALLELAQPEAGLVAPRIREPGRLQPEPHRALVTPCEILRRGRPHYTPPKQPAWVPGMFMLLRASAYAQIGGFDRRYHMYGEDFDLCARLRLVGWQLQTAEQLQVRHEAQRASHRNWRHLYWHFGSLAKVWLSGAFWRYRALEMRTSDHSDCEASQRH